MSWRVSPTRSTRDCRRSIYVEVGYERASRRNVMRRRMLIMVGVMVAVVVALGLVKFMQIRAAMAQGAYFQMPPEAVTTIVASEAEWPTTLNAVGTVEAVHGVTVSADLPGVIDAILFDSGRKVGKG